MKQVRFFSAFVGLFVFGAATLSGAKVGDASPQLLEMLKLHQKKIPFKSKFVQLKVVREMGLELPSEGELEVKKAGVATWKMLKPAFLSVEMSPEEIKIFNDPKASPRVIKRADARSGDMQGGDWMNLLMEDPKSVLKNFEISEIAKNRFKLLPKSSMQGFDWVELAFSKAGDIEEFFIQENKEDSLKIKFTPGKVK